MLSFLSTYEFLFFLGFVWKFGREGKRREGFGVLKI